MGRLHMSLVLIAPHGPRPESAPLPRHTTGARGRRGAARPGLVLANIAYWQRAHVQAVTRLACARLTV